MGRLTTIADVEKREAEQDDEQMRAAQEAMLGSRVKSDVQSKAAPRVQSSRVRHGEEPQATEQSAQRPTETPSSKSQAQKEVDFHGLDSLEKKSGGHIALIVVAIVIVIAAALKIANVF